MHLFGHAAIPRRVFFFDPAPSAAANLSDFSNFAIAFCLRKGVSAALSGCGLLRKINNQQCLSIPNPLIFLILILQHLANAP
jgi:hypothetical protein